MTLFKYHHPENERAAHLIFKARVCILVVGLFNLLAPYLMALQVADYREELRNQATWLDQDPLEENPVICELAFEAPKCPTDWTQSSDDTKCLLLDTSRRTFAAARAYCEAKNASLVSIADSSQNQDVFRLCGSNSPCWIGLVKSDGIWKWESYAPVLYTNWYEGEPDSKSAAAMGFDRIVEDESKGLNQAAGASLLGILIFNGVISVVLLIAYLSLKKKATSGLLAAACGDGCCSICCCLLFMIGLAAVSSYPGAGTVLMAIFALILMCSLASMTVYGITFRGHMMEEEELTKEIYSGMMDQGSWAQPAQPVLVGQSSVVQPVAKVGEEDNKEENKEAWG